MRTAAARTVAAPPETVYGFLEELGNHWQLTSGFASVESVDGDGARIVVHGPLGLRKRAQTRLLRAVRPSLVAGTATDAAGTTARVEWRIAPSGDGSRVELVTAIDRPRGLDRLLLRLGAGWWIRRGLVRSLRRLEEVLGQRR